MGSIADPGHTPRGDRQRQGQRSQRRDQDRSDDHSRHDKAMTRQYDLLPNGILGAADGGAGHSGARRRHHDPLSPVYHSADSPGDSPIKTVQDLKGKTIGVTSVEARSVISVRAVLSERYKMNAASIGGDFKWAEIPAAQFEAALKAAASMRWRSATSPPTWRRKQRLSLGAAWLRRPLSGVGADELGDDRLSARSRQAAGGLSRALLVRPWRNTP